MYIETLIFIVLVCSLPFIAFTLEMGALVSKHLRKRRIACARRKCVSRELSRTVQLKNALKKLRSSAELEEYISGCDLRIAKLREQI